MNLELINSITGESIHIASDDEATRWINSTTPWAKKLVTQLVKPPEEKAEHPQLIHDILKWSQTKLPLWQRDALRRLFQSSNSLSENSYSELYLILKQSRNIKVKAPTTPLPLALSHLPAITKTGEQVIIKSVRDFENVNRIATKQKLNFTPSGMTVIYGGNGTGKSGYVRVLKSVCRSRGRSETVLADATNNDVESHKATARFDILSNGQSQSLTWQAGISPPDDLAKISVFDTRCARAYLTEEQEVVFLPYGLDILEQLTNIVIPEISKRLHKESDSINIDSSPFNHLLGDTKVGNLIRTLSPKTKPESIDSLVSLSDAENIRLSKLNMTLSATDPSSSAKESLLSAQRIKKYINKIETCYKWVCDDSTLKIRTIIEDAQRSSGLEALAAEELRSGETLLTGTGEDSWKALFESARKFSTEIAYPQCGFPYTEDALCPLCQQDVTPAAERLNRFEEYIQNDIAQQSKNDKNKLETAILKITNADLDINSDQTIIDEINELDPSILDLLLTFKDTMKKRQSWIINLLIEKEPCLSQSPIKQLRKLAATQLKSYRTYLKASDATAKQLLIDEQRELCARNNLSKCAEAVKSLLVKIKQKALFEACEKDLKTQPISKKSKELASSAITSELKAALDKEFKQLGISHIKTKLKDRNVKGTVKHQLLLDLPSSAKLETILSEGEQRAIALGSFLADLHIANHSCGIIFDDPVSSLDHARRQKVAKRLAIEAKTRQVIVFTHDLIFVSDLISECGRLNAEHSCRYLEQVNGFYGNVSNGLPWIHKSHGDKLDKIETEQKALAAIPWPDYPSDDLSTRIHQQYNHLRSTIERCIEEVLLARTVQRFDSYIRVKNLSKIVNLEQCDVDEIIRLTNRCHDLIDAHDSSSSRNDPPPTPEDLKQDVDDLRAVLKRIKDNRAGTS